MKKNLSRTIFFLLSAVISLVPTAQAQQTSSEVEKQALTLAHEMFRAGDVDQWISANKQKISPEIADAADNVARQALANRDLQTGRNMALFAAYSHQALGESSKFLYSLLITEHADFTAAEKADEYAKVRDRALNIEKKAVAINDPGIAFAAEVVAGDCSFFSSEGPSSGLESEKELVDGLGDAVRALSNIKFAPSRFWLERFVSSLAALSDRGMRRLFSAQNHDKVNALLKQMAAGVEQNIPLDFVFTIPQWGDRRKSIEAARNFADLSMRHGNPDAGRARLAAAGKIALGHAEPDLWAGLLTDRYQREKKLGTSAVQLRELREEARSADSEIRAAFHSRAGRIWASYRADSLFGEMLRDQLSEPSPDPSGIFAAFESLKARTLLDSLVTPPIFGALPRGAPELQQQVLGFAKDTGGDGTVLLEEMKLVSQLSNFEGDGESVHSREKTLSSLETLHVNAGIGFQSVAAPAKLADVQQALQPREGLLEYVIPYNPLHPASDLWIFLITHDGLRSAHLPLDKVLPPAVGFTGRMNIDGKAPLDASALGQLVTNVRTAIRTGDEKSAREQLQDLFLVLLQPIADQGVRWENFDRLVIVPHGMLHYVPFAALMDGKGSCLIAKTAVTVAPSASVWLALTKRAGPLQSFVGFGNPDLHSRGAEELKYAAQEIAEVPKRVPALTPAVFAGPEATEDRFLQEAPSANILHISTHGEFPGEDALDLHAILLTKGKVGDGSVNAGRVRTLKLTSTRLVVLSVCNGGLYRIGPADEPYGLVPAFLEAGSQNVLGTLWKLDDQFGKNFMVEFYSHVVQDGPAEAYRKTCLHFLEKDEDLRNWAAFILVGPGRPFSTFGTSHPSL